MATTISYTIPDERIKDIGEMLQYTTDNSTDELLSTAMALLEWAVGQSKAGRDIVAINGNSGSYITLNAEILKKAKG